MERENKTLPVGAQPDWNELEHGELHASLVSNSTVVFQAPWKNRIGILYTASSFYGHAEPGGINQELSEGPSIFSASFSLIGQMALRIHFSILRKSSILCSLVGLIFWVFCVGRLDEMFYVRMCVLVHVWICCARGEFKDVFSKNGDLKIFFLAFFWTCVSVCICNLINYARERDVFIHAKLIIIIAPLTLWKWGIIN